MTDRKRVVVLGGGISGLTTAWRLRELGIDVEVCEAEDFVGGLAGTVREAGGTYCLDFGPHFFITQKHEIVRRISELLGDNIAQFRRSARIYIQGRFLDYPLSAKNVLLHFPPADAVAAVVTYGLAQIRLAVARLLGRRPRKLHMGEWASQSFGSHLAKVFFRPYTENFWKMPSERLSADTLPTSTRLNFAKSLRLLFVGKVTREAKSLTERELVLPLRYPKRGFGMIAESVAERVTELGGKIHVGTRVTRLDQAADGKYVVSAVNKAGDLRLSADFVVSTIPLPDMMKLFNPAAPASIVESANNLGYLSMIVLYVVTGNRRLLDTSYVYYLGKPYHRLGDMNKFCADLCPPHENMLAIELSCHRTDPVWKSSAEELLELCLPYLEADRIISRDEVRKVFLVKAASAYPIFYYDYREHLDNVLDYVGSQPRLALVGRTGEYRYIDSDQCMERAIALAEAIAQELN
ncbi:MAG: FAD-dependent oxidoreductase [Chloroflexi bacterium]|nr:FAD-dependent oxidoreductase [Chloroflexota bacterium]